MRLSNSEAKEVLGGAKMSKKPNCNSQLLLFLNAIKKGKVKNAGIINNVRYVDVDLGDAIIRGYFSSNATSSMFCYETILKQI